MKVLVKFSYDKMVLPADKAAKLMELIGQGEMYDNSWVDGEALHHIGGGTPRVEFLMLTEEAYQSGKVLGPKEE